MTWDQIEDKWTEMTRRIRADWRNDPASVSGSRRADGARKPARGASSATGLSETGDAYGFAAATGTIVQDAGPSDPEEGGSYGSLPTIR